MLNERGCLILVCSAIENAISSFPYTKDITRSKIEDVYVRRLNFINGRLVEVVAELIGNSGQDLTKLKLGLMTKLDRQYEFAKARCGQIVHKSNLKR